jgi:hypothetical protein
MTRPSIRYFRWVSLFSLTVVLGSVAAFPALGQFQTTDPYKPYNIYYKPFTYPIQQGESASLPNQARLNMFTPGGMSYQSMDGYNLFGRGTGRLEGIAGGDRDRSYQANPGDEFYDEQLKRENKYFEAMSTKDRRKRAALLREYNEMTRKAALNASAGTVRRAPRKPAAKANENAAPADAKPDATADEAAKPDETKPTTPSLLRRPSDLVVPRGGRTRGGLLRNSESDQPKASSPSDILNRSLESEKKPAVEDTVPPVPR